MGRTARVLGGVLAVGLASVLSGCVIAPSQVVAGSSVTVAVDTSIRVLNPGSAEGAAAERLGVDLALYSGFATRDADGDLVADPSFGEVTVIGEDPLTVRYTVADRMVWSDGVPVDAVDLLLDWAAHSSRWTAFATNPAWPGAADTAELPALSADRKSLTVVYEGGSIDDAVAQFAAPMPAHVAAMQALRIDRQEVAKDAVITAVQAAAEGDATALNSLARFWSDRFTVNASPEVLVSSGPYLVGSVSDGLLELRPNSGYAGDRRPHLESVRIATLPALEGLQALAAGEAEVLAVAPDEEVRALIPELGMRLLTAGGTIQTLVAIQRETVTGIDVGFDGSRVLWNLADWAPAR